jgi:two-component system KDP operon response regulator KdpE
MATAVGENSRVLVVDDEPQITRVLRTVLSSQGYSVRTASEGEAALSNFVEFRPELVITDLYMPHMDGIELCKRIRAMSTVPIIVLSVKGEERTKVEALDSGADDYVTKPFGIDELLARSAPRCAAAAAKRDGVVRGGEFRVDLEGRRVHARGNEVRLTPKEFELFVYMARHPNRVITHLRCSKRCGAKRRRSSRIPARVHGPAAQEARAGSIESALSRDRAVGRLPLQPARLTASLASNRSKVISTSVS